MPRPLLFGLVAPWIACLLALAVLSYGLPGKSVFDETPQMFWATLFGGYGIALLPMVPAGIVDSLLTRFRWRPLVTGLTAFGIIAGMAYGIATDWSHDGFHLVVLLLGLAAGMPAALASWLVRRAG